MNKPKMIQVCRDEINVNLAHWEGQENPILAVHGIMANCRCWDLLANNLVPKFNFYAMDLRGRGQSDRPSEGYSIDHHVRDILGYWTPWNSTR